MPSAKRPCYEAAAAGSSGPISGGLSCLCMCVSCCVASAEYRLVRFHPVDGCCLRGAGVQFPFNTFRPNLLSRVHSPGVAGCVHALSSSRQLAALLQSLWPYKHIQHTPVSMRTWLVFLRTSFDRPDDFVQASNFRTFNGLKLESGMPGRHICMRWCGFV